jgi:hypothetical protein
MTHLGSRKPKMRLIADKDLQRLLDEAGRYGQPQERARHPNRYSTLLAILATYGPRLSEALLLRWSNVDFNKKTITFPTLKQWKKDPATGRRNRVNASRTLPLLDDVVAGLLAYRKTAGPGEALFPTTRRSVWRAFKIMLGRAGLDKRFRVHDLRHTAASRVAHATRDPVIVRDLLGHSSISISDVYLHAIDFREKLASVPPVLPSPQDDVSRGAAPTEPRAGMIPPGGGHGDPPPAERPQQPLCIPPGYEDLALWFFPPLQAPLVVWEAMRTFFKRGHQEDKDYLRELFEDLTEDAKKKLPITPEGREQLRLAIVTQRTCDDLLGANREKLQAFIRVAHETLVDPGDPIVARVRELAKRATDREWLTQQQEVAISVWSRYRIADCCVVGEEVEGWQP